MRTPSKRTLLGTASAVAAVMLALACGLGGKGGGNTDNAGATTTPGSPTTPDSADLCTAAELTITAQEGPSGSTHRSVILIFTNSSSAPCSTKGFPAVNLLDGSDTILEAAAQSPSGYLGGLGDGVDAPQLVLNPGDQASAMVETEAINDDGTSCTPYAAMQVWPPFNVGKDPVKVTWVGDGCSAPQVHAVVAGTTG
ncbi:MAG TPA: DUF4232 domain-containing protein [Micromonosporaceae bacterium]|jgi:hypothetical protein